MMANLVLAALIIKSAVSAQMDYAKSTLGGTVSIQADMDKIRENQNAEMKKGGDKKEMFGQMKRPSVSAKTANEIAANNSDYVRDYSYTLSASANSNGLETVENEGVGGPGGMKRPEEKSSTKLDGDITISGINAYAYIDGVKNESMTIKDGAYFDEDSENGVMISYEFANLNRLKVGDKFKLKNAYTEKEIELSVVGIYDSSEGRADANTIYMNTETAAKFLSSDDYNDGNYDVENVKFYMNNSDKADEFVEKINNDYPELESNNLKVAVDTSEYDLVAGSIESVGSFANTILTIVIIAAIIIITLIVTINVKDRRYEIGVLTSLGASKKNVIGQIAAELLIVGTIGFAFASVTGTLFAGTLGNKILESQTTASNEQSEKNFGRPGAMGQQPPEMNTSSNSSEKVDDSDATKSDQNSDGTSKTNDDNLKANQTPPDDSNIKNKMAKNRAGKEVKLNINAEPIDYLLLFVTGYLVIIVALIIPSISIMRYQPKEILAGKE